MSDTEGRRPGEVCAWCGHDLARHEAADGPLDGHGYAGDDRQACGRCSACPEVVMLADDRDPDGVGVLLDDLAALEAEAEQGEVTDELRAGWAAIARRAAEAVRRAQRVEELAWVDHWGHDALWSTLPDPDVLPPWWHELSSELHRVLDHGGDPHPARIHDLRERVEAAYGDQRAGLSLADQLEQSETSEDLEKISLRPDEREDVDEEIAPAVEPDAGWAAQVGPAYRPDAVADMLGVTTAEVASDPRLLRLLQEEAVYPAMQFDEQGQPLAGVGEVVQLLRPAVASEWTIASWLTSPQPTLAGDRPIDRLRTGDVDAVLAQARALREQWGTG